ncbi:cyclic lactone autoinducer peptide [Clostridium pasteurianum]|uniref:Cyclic lactone autoinducer peptide n=1 Tax=Clostridium pasteurianum BC1 TaxID=86416 RepID=R4K4H1_CLOPA|nr:cyclic lactone autoinducer peptide [Clostridium pasteurianum]AGK97488.1 hypothetical protein Clopa_2631 [Clostridium pasteurianum BC1]
MTNVKKLLTAKVMKVVGSVALFLGTIVIVPTSTMSFHQPKCPDELLK